MWPTLAPFIDELGAAAIGRYFLWHRKSSPEQVRVGGPVLPEFQGDLQEFYFEPSREIEQDLLFPPGNEDCNGVQHADGFFTSPVETAFPENDRVHVRRWWGQDTGLSVVGLAGLVHLSYYWFDRLAESLASRGVEFLMMDEPFNHYRTPQGFRPGELIAGGGPEQLIAAVRQAVIDARALIAALHARGRRVGLVGQSYGGWLCLLLALLEPDLEFVVPLIPMCDLPAWYRAGLPLSRGARRRFPHFSGEELAALLRPVNPIAWKPEVAGDRIDLHAAQFDRVVLPHSTVQLAKAWGTRFTFHREGHYSVFFGDRLRARVAAFILERVAREPLPESWCSQSR